MITTARVTALTNAQLQRRALSIGSTPPTVVLALGRRAESGMWAREVRHPSFLVCLHSPSAEKGAALTRSSLYSHWIRDRIKRTVTICFMRPFAFMTGLGTLFFFFCFKKKGFILNVIMFFLFYLNSINQRIVYSFQR